PPLLLAVPFDKTGRNAERADAVAGAVHERIACRDRPAASGTKAELLHGAASLFGFVSSSVRGIFRHPAKTRGRRPMKSRLTVRSVQPLSAPSPGPPNAGGEWESDVASCYRPMTAMLGH